MKKYFEITPLVVAAGERTEIRVKALYEHVDFERNEVVKVNFVAMDGRLPDGSIAQWGKFAEIPFKVIGRNELVVTPDFPLEGEYTFEIHSNSPQPYSANAKDEIKLVQFQTYALKPDLYKLQPYCGDFHIHSFNSDGKESPEYVAASARRIGLDFMALTDHRLYEPSLKAKAFVESMPTDLRCYPGEEVHAPDNPVHIINFGSSFSVNSLYRDEPERYVEEVTARLAEVETPMTDEERFQCASSEWVFDKIQSGGGVAMFCHPFWRPLGRVYISDPVCEEIVRRCNFDCYEVIGGYNREQLEENQLAVAHYQQLRTTFERAIPPAGVSDAHGCDGDLFGWYRTLVFADSTDFEDLKSAIKENRSLALEEVPGEFPRLIGDFRLAKLGYFLLREYFPKHRELCRKEGELLLEALQGSEDAVTIMAQRRGRVGEYLAKAWPRK